MNDDINNIVIVNLSNDDDDNNSIPTPTITTVKAIDALDRDNNENDNDISNNNENGITNPDDKESTEFPSNESATERIVFAEPDDFDEEEEQNNEVNQRIANSDASLSDIDLNQMISEQLNTDFTEVDLSSSLKDESKPVNISDNNECAANLLEETRPVLLQEIIENVDQNNTPVVNTTSDIINTSLMKLNEDNNNVDESVIGKLNLSMDDIYSTESESSSESDISNDSINIKIILSSPDNEETEVFNSNNIKIIVTDPDNYKQIIYPYHESGLKEAVDKAIDRHKIKSKTKTPTNKSSKSSLKTKKSKSKKSKKVKKSVRFNIENDNYNSDNEVIPMVDENSVESLRREIDRLNSRIVEEIKTRTILQHTLDDTIIESEKVKKEAIEKSDLKIRETMEYAHRLQESMDKRINKMQNDSLEKYKELQMANEARLEEEREVWRQIEQDARKRLQDERDEKNKIIEENKRLEKVIDNLKHQIEEEASNSERFQLSVKQMLEEYEAKYKEEQENRKNAEEVIDRVLEKSRDFQENVEDLNFINRNLKENNRDLSEKLAQAESKIEYKDKLIEELKSKMGDLNFTIQILKEESETNIEKIRILSSETQNITDRSIQQINEVREENVNIYKLLDSTTKKYDELQTLYNVKEEEIESLKKRMEQMTKKFKRILRKNINKTGSDSANTSPISSFGLGNNSFEIMSNISGIKDISIDENDANNTNNISSINNSGNNNKVVRKKASNASISSATLSISSLLMSNQNDLNTTPILPYGINEPIKEEDEFEDEVIPDIDERERRSSKDSNSSQNTNNSNTLSPEDGKELKKVILPKLNIQTSNDQIIETLLSAQDSGDESDEDTDDGEYKGINNNDLSNIIEKRIMDFRTDNIEYLDFVDRLKVPSKITNAKFIKRCETEEIAGCLSFEGEYSGFFNNRKLWNNAKSGTILIEPITKLASSSESSDDTAVVELPQYSTYKCSLCSLCSSDITHWFRFKASEADQTYEKICPYCREKLANVCEWYSYIRLIQNNMIKKNPKYIFSDLLDIKRKLFYSKNGITFKYQN